VSDGVQSHIRTATVSVNVYDINDNAPSFNPPTVSVRLSRFYAVGYIVTRVSASDKDFGRNGTFTSVKSLYFVTFTVQYSSMVLTVYTRV